jgi:hypothetical protein
MSANHLYIVYDSNNSHFIDLETSGKYIFKLFTDQEEFLAQDLISEFHLQHFRYLHQYFLGPFPDSNEVRKMAYEIGEFYEVESVILLNKAQYSDALLKAFHRSELFKIFAEVGDSIKIDPDPSDGSLWNKIFN